MSNQYTVDTERIHAASGDITRISADIESRVSAMMGTLTALQDAWRGSASERFQGVVAEWRGTQTRVHEALDHISLALGRAGAQYAETEQANTSMFA